MRFILIFLLVFLPGSAFGYFASRQMPMNYETEAILRYTPDTNVPGPSSTIDTVAKDIYDRVVMERVAVNLGWIDHQSAGREMEVKILDLQQKIHTEVRPAESLIIIRSHGANPVEATEIVNNTAREAEAFSAEQIKKAFKEQAASINRSMELLKKQIEEAEFQIVEIKRQGIVVGMTDMLKAELSAKDKKREELLLTLKKDHPDIAAVEEEAASLKKRIEDISITEARLKGFQDDLTSLVSQRQNSKDQFEETQLKEAQVTGYFRVDQYGLVPEKPVGMDPKFVLIFAVSASAVLGLLMAFLLGRPRKS